ncbi:NAD(P)-dependent oxidoreductase [Nostocoides jenkinsii]|uniref:NAD-dependent epimerase/dehydratase n=1 Tax=Nostocoides jenkinsii Ben 74 TaxID=1193518 RepID=A0A077MAL5_9MICO|nr:NAD(P)H-binding protein [Tetrasphaera jenkinsii]CCI53709.1 NAD-dependent epimerase/dehydratase [Tetrasphaera jenkinsii Ben 74]
MRITVIGATGMIGSRVVAEAAQRGHDVTALSRSGRDVLGASTAGKLDLSDTAGVREAIDQSDATVIAVPSDRTGGSHEPTIEAHRNLIADPPRQRVLVVGGAGSLVVDGIALKDSAGFPVEYRAEAETFTTILELYRESEGVDWTLLSPAPAITPGVRTGGYVTGADSPVGAEISAEDFAVAVVDELQYPAHRLARFTVAAR